MHVSMEGFYRVCVTGADGIVKTDTGWFPNLITNQGLDWFGAAPAGYPADSMSKFAAVGTGNAAPTFADTTLTAAMTPAAVATGSVATYVSGPPAYYSIVYSYQWAAGAIVGNIAEVGIGGLVNPNAPYTGTVALFSHALILDSGGNPTTISVLSTDTLSVSYEARLYLNITDTNYSLTIDGTTYSGLYRPADIATPTFSLNNLQSIMSGGSPAISYYPGAIGAITSHPSGTSIGGNPSQISWGYGTYTLGTYTIQATSTIAANSQGAINITAIMLTTLFGRWQFSVSPSWNRAAFQSLSTTFALSWSRYTP